MQAKLRLVQVRAMALTAIALFLITGCADKVRVFSAPLPSEWGVIVDGTKGGAAVNDARYTDTDQTRTVGNFTSGGASNEEVTAFTNRRPLKLVENVNWTSDNDDVANVTFSPEISVPVAVWIVQGPFDDQRDLAIDHCVTTSGIWQDERMGVRFSQFEIIDATGDPDAATYADFNCTMQAGIEADIGQRANRINVYWVDTVDGGTGRGQACAFGSDFVAMGSTANDELLVHEFGHNFDLRHIDGQATFDMTNIMHSASSTRAFITEGQLHRAHLNDNSALNTTYGARPGEPTRTCAHNADTNDCPVLNTRIWADGAFPAN